MASPKGFFELLLDFSFSEFIALRLVGFLYGLAIFFAGLGSLSILLAGFGRGFATGLGALILAPLLFLFNVVLSRIILETLVVAFRTAMNTGRTAENTEYLRNS